MSERTLEDRLAHVRVVAMDVDGTFTDGSLFYDAAGNVLKGFCAHDGLGLELLRRAEIKRGFITGRADGATDARARALKLDFHLSGIGDKSVALRQLSAEFDIPLDDILYMGDDLNDYTAYETAGVTVAVRNACHEIKAIAHMVTSAPGGHGAVREVVDRILHARGIDPVALWKTNADAPVGRQ